MSAHAVLSPSSAPRWMRCTGSVAATSECGDSSSSFAREGTAAHELAERALTAQKDAEFYRNTEIVVEYEEDGETCFDKYIVDDEMIDNVQVYLDQVRRQPGELHVEQRLDLSEVYGVEEQFGTGDAIILNYEAQNLQIRDLKYGRGVQVYAKDNEQLYSYAAAALVEHDLFGDWQTITVAIDQPRLGHCDEHTLTRAELEEFMAHAKERAQAAHALIGADPAAIEAAKTAGSKQCQWCPIKATCPTLATWTHEQVFADFTALDATPEQPREAAELDSAMLGKLLARADIIEATTKAWRAECLRRVELGIEVPGWKLVEGRMGARKWSDEDEARDIMKKARFKDDEMYTKKLLTAPQAEKYIKKKKPRVWTRLTALITQERGKPSLAPESDGRPALTVATAEAFHDQHSIDDLL